MRLRLGRDDGQLGDEPTGRKLKDAVVRFKSSELLNLLPKAAGGEAIEAGLRGTHEEPDRGQQVPYFALLIPDVLGTRGGRHHKRTGRPTSYSCRRAAGGRKLDYLAGITALFSAPLSSASEDDYPAFWDQVMSAAEEMHDVQRAGQPAQRSHHQARWLRTAETSPRMQLRLPQPQAVAKGGLLA